MARVTGTVSEKAATPTATTSTRRICSVAYAEDESTSEDRTASAVGFPRRSVRSCSLTSGGPSSRFLMRYPTDSGSSRDSGVGSAAGARRSIRGAALLIPPK